MRGREPAWNVFADLDEGLWTELVPCSSTDRIVLPAVVRRRLEFLVPDATTELLAIIDALGFARLVRLDTDGAVILNEVRRTIALSAIGARSDLVLAAMSKYVRISVEKSGRFVMPSGLALHLAADTSTAIRVLTRGGQLFLWRERAWLDAQNRRLLTFPG